MATRHYGPWANGQTADGGQVETDVSELYTNIDNSNIASGANISVSKTELVTYTPWTDWTPTYTASGSMTVASTSTVIARYMQLGKTVHFEIYATMTTGGTASTALRFTLPITPKASATANSIGGGCWVTDSSPISGYWGWNTSGYIQCFKYDLSNFGLGASRALKVQGFYEVV